MTKEAVCNHQRQDSSTCLHHFKRVCVCVCVCVCELAHNEVQEKAITASYAEENNHNSGDWRQENPIREVCTPSAGEQPGGTMEVISPKFHPDAKQLHPVAFPEEVLASMWAAADADYPTDWMLGSVYGRDYEGTPTAYA